MKTTLDKEVGVSAITIKPEDIALTLKRIREVVGLSQLQVAEKAGFSSGATVANYERGLRAMDSEKLNKILTVYGMAVASITFRKITSFDIDEAVAASVTKDACYFCDRPLDPGKAYRVDDLIFCDETCSLDWYHYEIAREI